MIWNCHAVEDHLTDYVDRLLAPADRQGFEAHVQGCARCARLLARVTGLVTRLHELEPLEAPASLVVHILDQTTRQKQKPAGWRVWLGRLVPQPKLAMGLASVLLTALMLGPALGIEWRKVTVEDLKPVNLYRATERRATLLYARGVKFVNGLRVVYEIQSRLQPATDSQPVPEEQKQQAPGKTENNKDKRGRESNRARELNPIPTLLAMGLPGRSL
jgi:anti-sigma factor RsiW